MVQGGAVAAALGGAARRGGGQGMDIAVRNIDIVAAVFGPHPKLPLADGNVVGERLAAAAV